MRFKSTLGYLNTLYLTFYYFSVEKIISTMLSKTEYPFSPTMLVKTMKSKEVLLET